MIAQYLEGTLSDRGVWPVPATEKASEAIRFAVRDTNSRGETWLTVTMFSDGLNEDQSPHFNYEAAEDPGPGSTVELNYELSGGKWGMAYINATAARFGPPVVKASPVGAQTIAVTIG